MYDFRSLMGTDIASPNGDSASNEALKKMIVQRLEDACGLLSPALWHGLYDAGKIHWEHENRIVHLQHFLTQGINKMLFIYVDVNKSIRIYFSCDMEKERFIIMRCEKGSNVYYNSLCGLSAPNSTDLAYLRNATEGLSENIKATFDSLFAN